jgi:hypothetical protein
MAKFRSKLVACYMCSKAGQKSLATQLKCNSLWAKLNHKNDHICLRCTDVLHAAIAGYDKLFLLTFICLRGLHYRMTRTIPSDHDVRTRLTAFRVDLETRYITMCGDSLVAGSGGSAIR